MIFLRGLMLRTTVLRPAISAVARPSLSVFSSFQLYSTTPAISDKKDNMLRSDLVNEIAETHELPKAKVEKILNNAFDSIVESLADGREVRLGGFGTFSTFESKARAGRHPITQEVIHIPAKQRLRFRPHKAFKELINGGSS